jgi:hypothetical protein
MNAANEVKLWLDRATDLQRGDPQRAAATTARVWLLILWFYGTLRRIWLGAIARQREAGERGRMRGEGTLKVVADR